MKEKKYISIYFCSAVMTYMITKNKSSVSKTWRTEEMSITRNFK